MRYIIAPIEAGEKRCLECPKKSLSITGETFCSEFQVTVPRDKNDPYNPLRLPACIGAEAKLKKLVGAGQGIVMTIATDNEVWESHVQQLREALAALKGE